jgi:predicted DNA-binding protein (UPF0251 family)
MSDNGNGANGRPQLIHTQPEKTIAELKLREETKEALRLRVQGWTLEAIGDRFGVHKSTILRRIEAACKEITAPSVALYREIQDMQIDALLKKLWPEEGAELSDRRALVILAALDRRAKLFGLDAKQRIELSTPYELPDKVQMLRDQLEKDPGARHDWLRLARRFRAEPVNGMPGSAGGDAQPGGSGVLE